MKSLKKKFWTEPGLDSLPFVLRFLPAREKPQYWIQCHLDKDNIAVKILFTASKHFVYSLFFYIQMHST